MQMKEARNLASFAWPELAYVRQVSLSVPPTASPIPVSHQLTSTAAAVRGGGVAPLQCDAPKWDADLSLNDNLCQFEDYRSVAQLTNSQSAYVLRQALPKNIKPVRTL